MAASESTNVSSFSSSNPSSSASSWNPEFKCRYDIFLSFRGLDTRKKFTDHLVKALRHEGFQTFMDDDGLKRGEIIESELQKAIRSSRMSVIVLSENYANSKACLFELQKILQQCKKTDHFVLPVFYEVDPSEIKQQAKNLNFEGKEVAVEKVKRWSAALEEVARMAGMVSQNQSKGHEAKFIEEIVGVFKSKLAGKHLRVGDHLVSMDSRTKLVDSWLKDRSTGAGILLICGMGGIGKTTIAKVVYNSNYGRFDAACFLLNISEVAKGQNGLVHLQRQLLSDIIRKEEREVNDVDGGCRRMKYVLRNKRVLLVLDDVDHTDQLFALAGQQDWFSPGSKIIITARLESVMNADQNYEVYRPEKFSIDESLELFSWHAFRQKHPSQAHMDLSKSFVQRCDGLPLALQVLGSSVRRKDIDLWESELQKLEATSDNTILEKLERSYDSLNDYHDKHLFLDIACFFAGKKKNDTISILEQCDYSALAGIHNLVDRNLLTIENGKLIMHQLLQDMGKQIVCRESTYPEKRSRIWRHQESFNILQEKIGTKKIKGLVLDMNMVRNSNMVVFEANTFEKMYNLRILKLSGVQLSGTYKAFPKRLGWLYWRDFPSDSFPNDFPLENLAALDMRYSKLKRVWKGTKVLGSLKILNLSHSPNLAKTPNFSRIPNLEKLVLKACPSLLEINESIVELQRIESLNLQDCRNLRKLPRNISRLESLVEIDISGCSSLLGAIEELEKMKSLQVLKAGRMDIKRLLTVEVVSQASIWPCVPKPRVQMSLASLPSSLVHLNLSHCNLTDDAFPRDLCKLSKLQHLFLGGNPISCLPNFIKDLRSLQTLDLSWCPKLQQILWPSICLENLIVTECHFLEKIMSDTPTSTKFISHGACFNLNEVQWLFKILPVREVDVELINNIGFFDLDSMADVEAFIVNCLVWSRKKRPIQILYEDHTFTTFFPGREVPHWFSNKNGGSTISFTATLSPHFHFRGLNLCLVYTLPTERDWLPHPLHFEINSKRSGMKRVYTPSCYGIPEEGGDMVWLSHCLCANLFTEDDEVEVSFRITGDGQIKECGVHLLYFKGRYEGKFIEEIVYVLKSKLVGKHMPVGDHLVGLDSRIEPLDAWLKDSSTGFGVLLISGVGGIGKMTIAKVSYNSNHSRYDAACFLQNIREVAKEPNGLFCLQRQLLQGISRKKELQVNGADDGHRRIEIVLRGKRVLLVLDDVDHSNQVTALVGQRAWFSQGSKIIITTRLKSMMNAGEIYLYKPERLSNHESLELFSWHAFGKKHPIESHITLSERFVQHCDGLPLALEVLGSAVRGKNIDFWESELQRLESNYANTILETLEISYNSIKDNRDKELFLDIACFFIGTKKSDAITILDACGYSALAGIYNLLDRNLLTIENEKLEMHRLLRDMGKQIVCRSKHPEERSRIWHPKESFDILREKIGTNKIEALLLDVHMLTNPNTNVFETNAFEKMYNLRLLKLCGVQLSGSYMAFPKRLVCLYWHHFPSESFPNDFPMENLVTLDLLCSNLKRFWTGSKVLGSLKNLNLSHSPKLEKTPDFSRIPKLEKLVLKACPKLFEVHESIIDLKRLESLNLQDCKNLRKLPRNISMVESLVEIDISGCSNLMGAIEELEKMKSLQVLNASRVDMDGFLTMEVLLQGFLWPWVPKQRLKMSMTSLASSLVDLNLSHCNLTEDAFPGDLSNLSQLRRLSLAGNPISSLPNFIKDLTGLLRLDLSSCSKLQQIIWLSIGLKMLDVRKCQALETITFEDSARLEDILAQDCVNLNYVRNSFRILPVRDIDVELLNRIGFFNLDSMADVEAFIFNCLLRSRKKLPILIMYEQYMFTTFFPGGEVPHWFSNKNSGSTISFTATSSPHFRLGGLNLCLVYSFPGKRPCVHYSLYLLIKNKSSGKKKVYRPGCFGIPEKGGDMIWLSHCLQYLFTEGDEVEVSFGIKGDGQIKECGVHLLYFEDEGEVSQYRRTVHSWD